MPDLPAQRIGFVRRRWPNLPQLTGLPRRPRGRSNPAANQRYELQCAAFANLINQIQSRLDFRPGARGWCYLLENEGLITKGEFADAEFVINRLRKNGMLDLDICAQDGRRVAVGIEELDDSVDDEIADWQAAMLAAPNDYRPFSFWEDLPTYVEIAVEKIDLRNLFNPVCQHFNVVIQNVGGWADLHVRYAMLIRFYHHYRAKQDIVLGYCGDHDPGGLAISDFLHNNLQEIAGATARKLGVGIYQVEEMIDALRIERFGLNYEFIEDNGLTWIDNLETSTGRHLDDPRHADHNKPYVQDYIRRFGVRKCEANALVVQPQAGRNMCRDWILRHVPADAVALYEDSLAPLRQEYEQALRERFRLVEE
jgi:hypothetical protein